MSERGIHFRASEGSGGNGAPQPPEGARSARAPEFDDAFDLESRVLCPDGTCIGVIGADGRCKECGARGGSNAAERAAVTGAAVATIADDDPPLDLESRVLCPDGACIGVIGADGRCKACGEAAGS